MAKNEQNIQASEDFIRTVLANNFKQDVPADALRKAAEALCDAIPAKRLVAA